MSEPPDDRAISVATTLTQTMLVPSAYREYLFASFFLTFPACTLYIQKHTLMLHTRRVCLAEREGVHTSHSLLGK